MSIFYKNYFKDYMSKGEICCIPFSVPTNNGAINLFLPLLNNKLICNIDVQTIEDIYEILLKDEWISFYYPKFSDKEYVYVGIDKSYNTVHALTKTPRFFVPKSLFDNVDDPIVSIFLKELVEHLNHFVEEIGRQPLTQVVNSFAILKLVKFGSL